MSIILKQCSLTPWCYFTRVQLIISVFSESVRADWFAVSIQNSDTSFLRTILCGPMLLDTVLFFNYATKNIHFDSNNSFGDATPKM